jgi:uncharacterized protein (DUF488 family)
VSVPVPQAGVPRLFTIGHSTRSGEEFMALLRAHGIGRLVDVRRYPGSRRYPHFSREHLSAALPREGVEYVHALELGGRRAPPPDSPNGAWRSASFRAYADHMASPEFQAWLARLERWAADASTAVMCAEAVPWRCHRQLIADALTARGVVVDHILSPGRADRHALNPHAVVGPDGRLTYPAAGAQQELL